MRQIRRTLKKQQIIYISLSALLVIALFWGGRTVPLSKQTPSAAVDSSHDGHDHAPGAIDFADILAQAKQQLTAPQEARITALENTVIRGDIQEQKIHTYHQLARFWIDSARVFEPYAYYTGEAAKLENSEKNLTFAARLFAERLMVSDNPAMQNWLASSGKVLFEQALAINPKNDSNRIGLGACYIFGNLGSNPMEGILPIRQIADKDPSNVYAQMTLGLGGKKSGQYDKAVERFSLVLRKDPSNIEAIFHIAECYDLKGDKQNAIVFYEKAKELVAIPEAKKELGKRIEELRK